MTDFFDDLEGELRRAAVGSVHDRALHAALDERKPLIRVVERRRAFPDLDGAQRPGERLGIVERRLDGDGPAVGARAEHLDRLHLAAELEHRMRQRPRLDVGEARS